MGAIYDYRFFDGTKTGPSIRTAFHDIRYLDLANIEGQTRRWIDENDGYSEDDFDSIYGDHICYSGTYATLDYIDLSRKRFKSLEDADKYIFDEDRLEKWYNAIAAKVQLDEKDRKEHGVKADKNGYVWCIFSLLAC